MAKIKELERTKALVEFYRKGDILKLQRKLGHKHLSSTYAYLHRTWPLRKLLLESY